MVLRTAHEKMLSITNHQRNANQNHNEILSHTCQNVYYQKTRNYKFWKGCGEKGTLAWECKLIQPVWKTVCRFLQKLKIELPWDPGIPLLGTYLKKMKTLIWKGLCTLVFIVALSTIAEIWKQPKLLEGILHIYIHVKNIESLCYTPETNIIL